jgi:putative endonuclease
MYILLCGDGTYYTGSTTNLYLRLQQHENGTGASYTQKRLPVRLIYFEEYPHIKTAFEREKQLQGWSKRKKEALMLDEETILKKLAECQNETHARNKDE